MNIVGSVNDINFAALMYDIISIQLFGLNAKVNFNYTVADVMAILSIKQLYQPEQQAS